MGNKTINMPIVFGCKNVNDEVRKNSSSGGVFYSVAKAILVKGGVVFGACFNENWEVVHCCVDNLSDLPKLQGSKYVQSQINDAYKSAEERLKQNQIVLFSGTPCQIAGLHSYLGKEYDNLYAIDFICHGVPSPVIWKQFLLEIAGEIKIKSISFRNKTEGWRHFSLKVEFEDGTEYRNNLEKDKFLLGFLKNVYLRPSCYNCKFKGIKRLSDITMADFWGVDKQNLKYTDDDMGTSFVMLNSSKAVQLWEYIADDFECFECDFEKSIESNSAAVKSATKSKYREYFYSLTDDNIINKLEKTIQKIRIRDLTNRIKRKIKRILKF